MHLTSWPTELFPPLSAVLERLYSLCPGTDTQTHLLHLSSHGEILPHIDNVSASGTWILGVSLGDERTLRVSGVDDKRQEFELSLPSGSVYLQKYAGSFHVYLGLMLTRVR
jgi:alkylated DNA repair protein alkB family protein 7